MPEVSKESIKNKLSNIVDGITNNMYDQFALVDWWPVLAKECQVYVHEDSYLAKRFDQINFNFCSKDVAKEILVDNLYALLRNKYFPKATDESQDKIDKIIKSFTTNLKTVLIRVSFNEDAECEHVRFLPDGCVAFRNCVWDFRNNKKLFDYTKIQMVKNKNCIYQYDQQYIIQWHIDINFEPLPFDINSYPLAEFIELIKEFDKDQRNYCFELMYNICHDINHEFSMKKFEHFCQILGFTCLQSFTQAFEILVGSGGNGKNSLFDGCFTSRVRPAPANIDMRSIEEDKFVSGVLENHSHNFFFETEAETLIKSKMIKQFTGSMYQMVEHKGEDRHSSVINCRHIWAANDQDKLKFSDTTAGFRRRINIFEIYYKWDSKKKFLQLGDYYDTTFSNDLHEIKEDISNTIMFIYFAMYGIKLATNNYTKQFEFTSNDWTLQYTDIDFDLREKVETITQEKLAQWFSYPKNREAGKSMFFDFSRRALYMSDTIKEYGINNYDEFIEKFIKDKDGNDLFLNYFVEHDVYMSVRHIQELIGDLSIPRTFTQTFKKTYNITQYMNLTGNKPYVKITFRNNRIKVVG